MSRSLYPLLAVAMILAGCENRSSGSSGSATPPPPVHAPDNTSPKPVGSRYLLRPTDILQVQMYREPDINQQVSISGDGDVVLPLIQKVHVAGLSLLEAQQLITEKYRSYYKEPSVSVLVLKYAERKVYFDGFVGRPGPVVFPAEEKMTLMRAISFAGGIQSRGERSDVIIKRIVGGVEKTLKVNVNDITAGRSDDIELLENDYVYVRESII